MPDNKIQPSRVHLKGRILGVLACARSVDPDGALTLAEEVDLAIPSQLGS